MRLGPGRVAVGALLFLLFVGFVALGAWQVERLRWKLDLIARVDARVHSAPVPAPAMADWPRVDAASDEYRQVSVTGRRLDRDSAYVQAVTEFGTGYWVLTPMRRSDGSIVIVNRGFVSARPGPGERERGAVPPDPSAPITVTGLLRMPEPVITVTGLLRMPEPGGGFLRHNDPAADRWYSRDVVAIAASRKLDNVAPFFVDANAASGGAGLAVEKASTSASTATATATSTASSASAASNVPSASSTEPIGGLTVVSFHNSHLVYAITWFVLALGTLAAAWQVRRAWIARDREALVAGPRPV